jgi:hypothetical protein
MGKAKILGGALAGGRIVGTKSDWKRPPPVATGLVIGSKVHPPGIRSIIAFMFANLGGIKHF